MKKTLSPHHLMFNPSPKRKPILYLTEFRLQKMGPRNWRRGFDRHHSCLLKYSPKYYRELEIRLSGEQRNERGIKLKVKQVKILKKLCFQMANKNKIENTLKGLIRTNQKTLRSLPNSQYRDRRHSYFESYRKLPNLHWHMYFPMIKSFDLSSWNDLDFEAEGNMMSFSRLLEQKVHKECGYFWMANRGLRDLSISNALVTIGR